VAGTDQVRTVSLDGRRLVQTTDPHPFSADGKMSITVFTWEKLDSAAQPPNQLVGTYRLVSVQQTVTATGETRDMYGKTPQGYIVYGPDGRMMVLFVKDERPKPVDLATMTDQVRADLFRSMTAYSGTYDFDGKTVIHHVDVSWNQNYTGTDQVRNVRFEGRRVILTTNVKPLSTDGKVGMSVLTFEIVD